MATSEVNATEEGAKRRWWVWPLIVVVCLVVGWLGYRGYRTFVEFRRVFGTRPWLEGSEACGQIAKDPRLESLWRLCRTHQAEILSVRSHRGVRGDAEFFVELRVDDRDARLAHAELLEEVFHRTFYGSASSLTGRQYLVYDPDDPEHHSRRIIAIVPHGTDDRIVYHAEEYD